MYDLTKKTIYTPSEEEYDFISRVYSDFLDDYNLKNQPQAMLGGRTLKKFWDQSEYDYNALCEAQNPLDPVVPYASGVSRDKANIFITNLALNLFYPTVVAQNSAQEIDRVMSKASRALLEFAHENDGRPAESGHVKFVRTVHKGVIQGTAHVQDDIVDNRLVSSIVPNEEIFVPNFYQPNIQLQSHLIRLQENITYGEAERDYGELPRFRDHVCPGMSSMFAGKTDSVFTKVEQMLDIKNKVNIMRVWYPVPHGKLVQYKQDGVLPSYVTQAKYFNLIINGIPMFPYDNLMPYHDGYYPINKMIFEMFSRPEYYWGNSLPNKIAQDKRWKDGWKTLLRWKGKLSSLPPLVTFNGTFVDSDITIPGMITQAPAGMGKDDIQTIPGLSAGINNSDIELLNQADQEISNGSVSNNQGGQVEKGRQTAREIVLAESNAKKILNGFALQTMFFVSARSFPIIKRMFQFLTRNEINKIAVPNQSLPDGTPGTLEIIFTEPQAMTEEEIKDKEYEMYTAERKSAKAGNPKHVIEINKEYWQEIDLYLKATVEEILPDNPTIRQAKAEMKFDKYASHPELFNLRAAARNLIRENGDDETEMLLEQQVSENKNKMMMDAAGGMGSGGGQNPLTKMAEQKPSTGMANDGMQMGSI